MSAAAVAAIGIGAAFGAWARWGLAIAFNTGTAGVPLGTLAANVVGGFLIGVAMEAFGRNAGLSEELRLLIITGFLGGLTTFSTFSAEVVANMLHGHCGWALAIAACHLGGSLLATFLGVLCVRWVAGG